MRHGATGLWVWEDQVIWRQTIDVIDENHWGVMADEWPVYNTDLAGCNEIEADLKLEDDALRILDKVKQMKSN